MRWPIIFLIVLFSAVACAKSLSIKSSAFWNQSKIPPSYTCNGTDIPPPLSWAGAPDKTQSYALILSDPDAPSGVWYHWIIYNIPTSTQELAEKAPLPNGTLVGTNSTGKASYFGPCPPPGKPHHYIFTLYALDTILNLPGGANASALQKAMEGHVLQSAVLTGLYGK